MGFDFGKILNFSLFAWAKQDGIWKYFLALFIFLFAVNAASSYMTYSLFLPFATLAQSSVPAALDAIFHYLSFLALLGIISMIVSFAFSYMLTAKALLAKGRKTVEFTPMRWLRFIILAIAEVLAAFFSVFKLRFLAIGIIGIVLLGVSIALFALSSGGDAILGIFGILSLIIAFLLLATYFVIIIYNCLRLSVSSAIFVEKERGIAESLKASWKITHANAGNVFIALLLVGIITIIISSIGSAPLAIYTLITSFAATLSGSAVKNVTMFTDPAIWALTIPAMITSALATIMGSFGLVGIYTELTGNSALQPQTPARKKAKKK